jgi:hypothetical protein
MSASQRVQILNDQSNSLSVLAEFIKNPDLISELEREVKRLNSLTELEEKKVAEARAFIQKHSEILADLKSKEDELNKRRAEHETDVAKFMNDTQDIRNLDMQLKNKAIIQSETDKRHEDTRKSLEEQQGKMLRQNEQERAKLGDDRAQNKKDREHLDREAIRLKEFEQTLKDKAKAMAALVG